MDREQKKAGDTTNATLKAANDQLGENATLEYSEDYDNKTNPQTKSAEKNTK